MLMPLLAAPFLLLERTAALFAEGNNVSKDTIRMDILTSANTLIFLNACVIYVCLGVRILSQNVSCVQGQNQSVEAPTLRTPSC